MRLIDADEFKGVINEVAEREGGMTKTMEYVIQMIDLIPTVTDIDGLQLFRDYMNLIERLNHTVLECKMDLSIADIRSMEMLSKFESILSDLQDRGHV